MKIDKSNPRHWFYLVIFTLNILIGIACAFVLGKTKRKTIVLYGHKLNGNLLAIYEYAVKRKTDAEDCDIYYLTMDPVYFGDLKSKGIQAYCALKPYDICSVCRSRYIVSDHGLHSLVILKNLSVETKYGMVFHSRDLIGMTSLCKGLMTPFWWHRIL